jgi:hypothetical protein
MSRKRKKLLVVLVTGGRDYYDKEDVFSKLDKLNPFMVVVGDCPTGADYYADAWAKARCVPRTTHFANWTHHGPPAGPLRNREMVDMCALPIRCRGSSR